jgi:hypothetical protein
MRCGKSNAPAWLRPVLALRFSKVHESIAESHATSPALGGPFSHVACIPMRLLRVRMVSILSALTPMLMVGLSLAAPPTTQPATWVAHDLNVDLYNLPQRYSCDDLRHKFRDVLIALGARPDLKVLTARCELGSRSPIVRLQFSMPELVGRTAKRGTVVETAAALVRLEPGHPVSLYAADCELMRQIKDKLLTPMSQRVASFNLACSAPSSKGARFSLSVQTLQPLGSDARVADEREAPLKRVN